MALHKDFPPSPHAILDPGIRWFPADEALRESSMEKLMPPLVAELRRKVKDFRDGGYAGATDTSRGRKRVRRGKSFRMIHVQRIIHPDTSGCLSPRLLDLQWRSRYACGLVL